MKHESGAEVTNTGEAPWLSLYVARPEWSGEFVSRIGLAATVRASRFARALFVTLVQSQRWANTWPPKAKNNAYIVLAVPGAAWADVRRKCETVFRVLMPAGVGVDRQCALLSARSIVTEASS